MTEKREASTQQTLDDEQCWQAVMRRDRLADGRFVFAVRSTGIYCRPSCPARRPRRQQVAFSVKRESVQTREENKMNYRRFNEEKKNAKQDFEALRRECFTEEEIKRLSQLRRDRAELEDCLTSAEYQRLVFVRWLVTTGKLSEQLA